MKYTLAIFIFLFIVSPVFAEELTIIEGRITSMSENHIVLENNKYLIVSDEMLTENPSFVTTQYFWGGEYKHPIDFNTILGVGYVDLARITLDGQFVREIEILELLQ